jgi:hypothetical protein
MIRWGTIKNKENLMNNQPLSATINKARAITYVASNNPDAFTTAQLIQIIKYANAVLHTTSIALYPDGLPKTPADVKDQLESVIAREVAIFEREVRATLPKF